MEAVLSSWSRGKSLKLKKFILVKRFKSRYYQVFLVAKG